MINLAYSRIAACIVFLAPFSGAPAQSLGALKLGVGQHVRIATRDSAALAGYVRATTDESIRLRVPGFAGDSMVTIRKAEIAHAEVAVQQNYSEVNALIGGVAGLAIGALAGLALNKSQSCIYPGECWRIDFLPLTSAIGFGAGLLAGWFERPKEWVSAVP